MRFSRRTPLLLAALAVIAACSDGGSSSSATTEPNTIELSTLPETVATDPPQTTTSSTLAATTTTAAPKPVYPLTGLPVDDANPLSALRTAVVVKVGNYDAHPQWGSNAADIIYEEIINANISRFAFVYQSQAVDRAGPIRSGRRQDVDLFGSFNAPIFAWAGGNGTVTAEVNNSDLVNLNESHCAGSCFRSGDDKPREFTLFFNVNKVWDVAAGQGGVPPQQFQYRAADAAVAGEASPGVAVKMDTYNVDWTWNGTTGLYERSQNGKPDKDKSGEQMTTNNVVVLSMTYLPGISGSPDAQSTGTGDAWVFSGGNKVHGTWTRADRLQVFTLTADDGTPILLTPGRTFIELPRSQLGNVTPK
ncbi:MAG: DUF3048 C-terminal domain-containing protein [Ilumatobacteraceae bacterium]